MIGLGWVPDDDDPRDGKYALSDEHLELPYSGAAAGSCEHLFADEPLYQNGHQSCVWQAMAQTVRAAHVRADHDDPPYLSRLAGWYPCRKLQGEADQNVGTRFRTGFQVLNTLGFCQEKHWPHDLGLGRTAPYRQPPPTEAIRLSADQRKGKQKTVYRRVFEVGDDRIRRLQQCIDNGFPPVFGTDVSYAFVRGLFDPNEPQPPPDSDIAGGHGMIAGAYRDANFRARSSWGAWADNGWCWMTEAFVARWRDIWVVEYAPWFTDA